MFSKERLDPEKHMDFHNLMVLHKLHPDTKKKKLTSPLAESEWTDNMQLMRQIDVAFTNFTQ